MDLPLLVGAISAIGAVLAAMRAPDGFRPALVAAAVLALGYVAAFDARALRAPNRVVYPLAAAVSLAPFALGFSAGLQALGGAAVSFGVLLLVVIVGRGAMGYGDAKVGFVCGAIVGVDAVLPMLLGTFVLGAAVAGIALGLRIRGRKDKVAFTPFLLGGVILALLLFGGSPYLDTA